MYAGAHEPIVEPALFDAVPSLLRARTAKTTRHVQHARHLKGLLHLVDPVVFLFEGTVEDIESALQPGEALVEMAVEFSTPVGVENVVAQEAAFAMLAARREPTTRCLQLLADGPRRIGFELSRSVLASLLISTSLRKLTADLRQSFVDLSQPLVTIDIGLTEDKKRQCLASTADIEQQVLPDEVLVEDAHPGPEGVGSVRHPAWRPIRSQNLHADGQR